MGFCVRRHSAGIIDRRHSAGIIDRTRVVSFSSTRTQHVLTIVSMRKINYNQNYCHTYKKRIGLLEMKDYKQKDSKEMNNVKITLVETI